MFAESKHITSFVGPLRPCVLWFTCGEEIVCCSTGITPRELRYTAFREWRIACNRAKTVRRHPNRRSRLFATFSCSDRTRVHTALEWTTTIGRPEFETTGFSTADDVIV